MGLKDGSGDIVCYQAPWSLDNDFESERSLDIENLIEQHRHTDIS